MELPLGVGRLLVANPLLPDPNFDRTVVLLIAFGEEGALGLVLNRPSQMQVAEPLPKWDGLAAEPPVLFLGGPVQHQAVICLARLTAAVPQGVDEPGPGLRTVAPGIATLDLEGDPSDVAGLVDTVRLFAGYAGWSAGQLEGELGAGAWWIVDPEPADPFSGEPDDLWKQVLRRQDVPLKFVSWFPSDPSAN
jgi:putative transcriptional regulator